MKKSLVDNKQKIIAVVVFLVLGALNAYFFILTDFNKVSLYVFLAVTAILSLAFLYLAFFSVVIVDENLIKIRFLFSFSHKRIEINRFELRLKSQKHNKNVIIGINHNDIVVLEVPFLALKPEIFGQEILDFLNKFAKSLL